MVSLMSGVGRLTGEARVSNVSAFCFPNSNITLAVKAELLDLTELPGLFNEAREGFDITNSTGVFFRPCVQGEIFLVQSCDVCAAASYSLESVVNSSTQCRECISTKGVKGCEGNQVRHTDKQTQTDRQTDRQTRTRP
jgi:hypothetical protein